MLLVATLVVWGMIGYRIISTLTSEPLPIESNTRIVAFRPQTSMEIDTFSIQSVDRDPFLGTFKQKTISTKKTTTTPQVVWPQITYGGLVKQQNTTAQIFVVNVNSNQYLLKKGQKIEDVALVKGNSKEVVLRFQNQTKTIVLQK